MTRLSLLNDADAVQGALDEFDRLGREAFLSKFGFGKARDYVVRNPMSGALADSKAVVAAAFGRQFPSSGPLRPKDFSGGEAGAVARLRALNFEVRKLSDEKLRQDSMSTPRRPTFSFELGRAYTREDVMRAVGLQEPLPSGGSWFTGAHAYGGAHFVFCAVGTVGRTGHNYSNHFEGDELVWSGRTGSRRDHPSIRSMIEPGAEVHVFFRDDNRKPFTYAGIGEPAAEPDDGVPVQVRWRLRTGLGGLATAPEDVVPGKYTEGATRQVLVNAYERNPQARAACVAHHGCRCKVCGLQFDDFYGPLGHRFIHVHHVRPLASVGDAYEVDPIEDLVPVCPNCHAMLHRSDPPMPVDVLAELVERRRKGRGG